MPRVKNKMARLSLNSKENYKVVLSRLWKDMDLKMTSTKLPM